MGFALGAILIFGTVVTMLNNRQYVCAFPVVLMMLRSFPATLAVPRADMIRFLAMQ